MDGKFLSCRSELFALSGAKKASCQGRPRQLNFAVRFVAQGEGETVGKSNLQGLVEKTGIFTCDIWHSRTARSNRTFSGDGNVLYLHSPTEKPLATSP